jgi:hypothetical protein
MKGSVSGARSVQINYGSGSQSRRLKNVWILWIWNTAIAKSLHAFGFENRNKSSQIITIAFAYYYICYLLYAPTPCIYPSAQCFSPGGFGKTTMVRVDLCPNLATSPRGGKRWGGGGGGKKCFLCINFHGHFPPLRSQEESIWITIDNVFYSGLYNISQVENKQDRQARSLMKFWL